MSCCCFSCCQQILLSINLIILGAPHCFIRMRHSDSHPDVVFIEMFPHLIVVNSLMSIKTWLCRLLSLKVQTLLQLLSLLLLLPLWFLLSFLIVVLLLQLLSANTVVNQFEHLRRLFFLISSLFSLLASLGASRPGKVRPLMQHNCAIDGAPHCLVLRRHSDPHPDVAFSSKCFRI